MARRTQYTDMTSWRRTDGNSDPGPLRSRSCANIVWSRHAGTYDVRAIHNIEFPDGARFVRVTAPISKRSRAQIRPGPRASPRSSRARRPAPTDQKSSPAPRERVAERIARSRVRVCAAPKALTLPSAFAAAPPSPALRGLHKNPRSGAPRSGSSPRCGGRWRADASRRGQGRLHAPSTMLSHGPAPPRRGGGTTVRSQARRSLFAVPFVQSRTAGEGRLLLGGGALGLLGEEQVALHMVERRIIASRAAGLSPAQASSQISRLIANTRSTTRQPSGVQPQGADAPVGRVRRPLDEPSRAGGRAGRTSAIGSMSSRSRPRPGSAPRLRAPTDN